MSIIRAIKHRLGLSVTPANNFVLDASADNGTMKLARESGQDIMTVDTAGVVTFPQNSVPAFIATINTQPVDAIAKILTATETVDTNNNFANNKFTPTVAGLYQVNLSLTNNISDNWCGAYIYKNGALVAVQIVPGLPSSLGGGARPSITALVQMNGTTDFIQAYGFNSIAGFSVITGHFSASLVRVAQ